MAKSKYDWDAIEKDYRTGRFSNVQLGKMYGPTEGTIRGRATKHGWTKDLSTEIEHGIRAGLQSDQLKTLTDSEIVQAAVQTGVELIREHREDVKALREIVKTVTTRLAKQLENEKITINGKEGPLTIDIPLEYLSKVLNGVTASLERLIRLERQAYGLDQDKEEAKGKTIQELMDEMPDKDNE